MSDLNVVVNTPYTIQSQEVPIYVKYNGFWIKQLGKSKTLCDFVILHEFQLFKQRLCLQSGHIVFGCI